MKSPSEIRERWTNRLIAAGLCALLLGLMVMGLVLAAKLPLHISTPWGAAGSLPALVLTQRESEATVCASVDVPEGRTAPQD